MMGERWTEVTRSAHPHEQEALQYLRANLPDRDPFRVWSNFAFTAGEGFRSEVDVLVCSPAGLFHVEVKSHPGRITGDAGQWRWTRPEDGRVRSLDNPYPAAELKGKRLKGLLEKQPPFKGNRKLRVPWITTLVFCSARDLELDLDEAARGEVRCRDDARDGKKAIAGIIETLTALTPRRGPKIDRPMARAVAQAMDAAGIRTSVRHLQVSDWLLGPPGEEGDGWQDFPAEHVSLPGDRRRLRLYPVGERLDNEERKALRRAAEQEYTLLRGLDHPGIASPVAFLDSSERGPFLAYPWRGEERRLDLWMAEEGTALGLAERLDLLRQLAEAMAAAHRARLHHRTLDPRAITVLAQDDEHGRPRLQVRDWPEAARRFGTTTGTIGTHHPGRAPHTRGGSPYLAPELRAPVEDPDPVAADVFGVGAVAVLLLTGQPPAPDGETADVVLAEHGSFALTLVADAAPQELEWLVVRATDSLPEDRHVTIQELLEDLDRAEEQLTRPETKDPLDATTGDTLDGGWTVVQRLGSGSTAVVLLAEREGRQEVLKVARDTASSARIEAEHDTLARLRHPGIIATQGLAEVGGRRALRLAEVRQTLSRRLAEEGVPGLEVLQRWGTDLLTALAYLETEGVAHRDVKPDNLGVTPVGKDDALHLVLLDFSLSRTPTDAIEAGTPGYLDPFLRERRPPRWDLAAERYAAAVVLHEMATGRRPRWGDGRTDPRALTDDTPEIAEDLLDIAIRAPLGRVLRTALHRDPSRRYGTADEMRRDWERAFAGGASSVREEGVPVDEVDLTAATSATSVADLGLADRVTSALERAGIATLGRLQEAAGNELQRLPGVGAETRREVRRLAERVSEEVAGPSDAVPLDEPATASVDRLARLAVPTRGDARQRALTAAVVGLDDEGLAGPAWPALRLLGERLAIEAEEVAERLDRARSRWRKEPAVTALRSDLAELLAARGGIAGLDEVALALLALRGSTAREPLRRARAIAALRAGVEAEAQLEAPRVIAKRLGERVLLLSEGEQLSGEPEEDPVAWSSTAATAYAAELGEVADALAARSPLASPDEVLIRLREVPRPEAVPALTDVRLVRIAAAASEGAGVSSRLELHPCGMDAVAALRATGPALLARGGLSPQQLRERVHLRFPEAARLPQGAALEEAVRASDLGLQWDAAQERYALQSVGGILTSAGATSAGMTTFPDLDDRALAVDEAERRLRRVAEDGGYVTVTVHPGRLVRAAVTVAHRLEAQRRDLDALLLAQMRAVAGENAVDWATILAADAAPEGSLDRRNLAYVVDQAVARLEEALHREGPTVVATGVGLLVRYGHLGLLDRLRETLTRGTPSGALRGLVVLVPGDDPTAAPVIDAAPLPVMGAAQWAHLPAAWLDRAEAA